MSAHVGSLTFSNDCHKERKPRAMLISEIILVRNLLTQANSGLEIWYVKFQTIQTAAGVILAATLGVRMVDASIVVTSYNHGPYIAQCLTSILEQTTERRLEIVWYDDASTDDTIARGEEALQNCPHEIIRIHQSNNRMQRKIPFMLDQIERCRGEFVFMTEGDDFWIDPRKIDAQIDALIVHPDIKLCFTPANVYSADSSNPLGVLARHSNEQTIFSLDAVIVGDGGFMPTNSLCIRREVFNTAPDWLYGDLPVGDYPMQVLGSAPNGALFLPQVTCGYRQNVQGSWTTSVFNVPSKRIHFEIAFLELLIKLHKSLPGHKDAFFKLIKSHATAFFKLSVDAEDYSQLPRLVAVMNSI
jgi:glycosyltransferase involved in cell wall biosynthesis